MYEIQTSYTFHKAIAAETAAAMRYPGTGLAAWKTDARKTLTELLGFSKMEKTAPELSIDYTEKLPGMTEIRFTFWSEKNWRVPCHLLLPDGVEKPPVMICVQGHSTGMHISLGRAKYPHDEETLAGCDRNYAMLSAKEGFAAVAMEQRCFGECGKQDEGGCLYSSLTALLCGRTTVGERVWDISRLIDVLEAYFSDRVDLSRIGCMGNSGGGTATAYAAATEDRLSLVIPSCAMCTYKDSIGAMPHCACNFVPRIAEYFDMGDLMAMAAPKYFIQVSGQKDDIFPLDGAKRVFADGRRAYEELGKEDRCRLVIGSEGHRFYAADAFCVAHEYWDK